MKLDTEKILKNHEGRILMNTIKLEVLIELLLKSDLIKEDIYQLEFEARIKRLEDELELQLKNQKKEAEPKNPPKHYFGEAGEA